MRRVEIEAFQDETRPEGGHAVIVLRGVSSVPDSRFRLRPIEGGAEGGPMPPWGDRDLKALTVETRDGSAGLIVGPELTDSPTLQPGLPLEILVPALSARGEFLWPAVAPPARPKRRSIVTRKSGEAAQPAVKAALEKRAAAPAAPPQPEPAKADHALVLDTPLTEGDLFDFVELGEEAPAADATSSKAGNARDAAAIDASPLVASPSSRPTSTVEPLEPATSEPSPEAREEPQPPSPARQEVVAAVAPPAPEPSVPAIPAEARPVLPSEPEAPQVAVGKRLLATPAAAPTQQVVQPAIRKRMPASVLVASLLAAVLAVQLASLFWLDVKIARRGAPAPVPAPAVAAAAVKARAAPAVPARSQPLIYDALAFGSVSPRGIAAEGVSPARSLERAHAWLRGGPDQRDTDEGLFWLKHHLAGSLGSERTRIVLTQLGSAYAEPSSGQPDFGKARAAWELAAAFGDPVAMCFLAAVHERGLGVAANPAGAREWLGRAQAAGGSCVTTAPVQPATRR